MSAGGYNFGGGRFAPPFRFGPRHGLVSVDKGRRAIKKIKKKITKLLLKVESYRTSFICSNGSFGGVKKVSIMYIQTTINTIQFEYIRRYGEIIWLSYV